MLGPNEFIVAQGERPFIMNRKTQQFNTIGGVVITALAALAFCCVCLVPVGSLLAEGNMAFKLTSTAFIDRNEIPVKYTCQGADVSSPLHWEGIPEGTRSLVLIVDDPDAPDPKAPKMTWVHWVLYNIPPDTTGLAENISAAALPPGTGQGLNDWGRTGYGGPCPPIGRHRYFHKLYALDTVLPKMDKPTKEQVQAAMRDHIIAKTELIGTYQKIK